MKKKEGDLVANTQQREILFIEHPRHDTDAATLALSVQSAWCVEAATSTLLET